MTEYLRVDRNEPDRGALERTAEALRDGGIVAIPTETVYGLAVAAANPDAVQRLENLKNRPKGKPFSYLLPNADRVHQLVDIVPTRAQALMNRYWPGPLTLILPTGVSSANAAPDESGDVSEGGDASESGDATIGLRVPADPIAQSVLNLAEVFAVAPSANPAGEKPATTADEVKSYFDGLIDVVLDAGPSTLKEASTVVRISDDGSTVLREGIITSEMIYQLLGGKTILFVCAGNTCRSPMAQALFRKHLARKIDRDVDDLEELGYNIASAGLWANWGSRASSGAVEAMKERGCNIASHISQPLTQDLLGEADRVYTMTASQMDGLQQLDPSIASRIQLISADGPVSDPIGGSLDEYRECAETIESAVKKIVESF